MTNYQKIVKSNHPATTDEEKQFEVEFNLQSNFLGYISLSFINPLFDVASNGEKIEISHLQSARAHTTTSCDAVYPTFETCLKEELSRRNTTEFPKKPSLWSVLWRTLGVGCFLSATLMCFLYKLTLIFGPIIILTNLVDYFEGDANMSPVVLWLLVCGLFIFPVIGAILFAHANVMMINLAAQVKGLLIGAIYRKVLVLSATERQTYPSGRILTLFSDDTNQISLFLQDIHRSSTEPIVIGCCVYLIYEQVGIATFAGFAYAILSFVASWRSLSNIFALRKEKLGYADNRSKLMNEVLNGIRVIRLYGWETAFMEKIQEVRLKELAVLAKIGYLFHSTTTLFLLASPFIQAIIIFAVYVYLGNTLTVAQAFTTLTLFGAMNSSFITLPNSYQQYTQAVVASKRIMTFLAAEELSCYLQYHDEDDCELDPFLDDEEKVKYSVSAPNRPPFNLTIDTKSTQSGTAAPALTTSTSISPRVAITLRNSSFSWASRSSNSSGDFAVPITPTNGTSGCRSPNSSRTQEEALAILCKESTDPKPLSLSAKRFKVGYSIDDSDSDERLDESGKDEILSLGSEPSWEFYTDQIPTLKKLSLNIHTGELVAIIGNVGSGKSSFLASLMGEMTLLGGSISVAETLQNKVAYCEQTPWVINASVKENILLGATKPFSQKDLEKAIYASGLKQDLSQLSDGIDTEVGEKGKTLSGGQRARISFARAVYSDAEIILLDDLLAAVDAHVSEHMFHKGIRKAMRGKTRLLVTHNMKVLPHCDKIIALEGNGKVGFVGTYDEFRSLQHEDCEHEDISVPVTPVDHSAQEQEEAEAAIKHAVEAAVAAIGAGQSGKSLTFDKRDSSSTQEVAFAPPANSQSSESQFTTVGVVTSPTKVAHGSASKHANCESATSRSGVISSSTYWSYITHGGILLGAITGFLVVASQAAQLYAGFWLADWGDIADENPSRSTTLYYLNVFAAIQMTSVVLLWLSRIFLIRHRYFASLNFHTEMLTNIIGQEISFFDITPIGQLLNRFAKDLVTVDDDLTQGIASCTDLFSNVFGSLAVIIVTTQGLIAIILVPLVFIYGYLYKRFSMTNTNLTQLEAVTRSPLFVHFSQTMLGLQSIRVYRCQELFTSMLDKMVESNLLASSTQLMCAQWVSLRLSVIGAFVIFAIGAIGVGFQNHNIIATAYLAMALSSSIKMTNYLKAAVRLGASTESQFNAVQRVDEYCHIGNTTDGSAEQEMHMLGSCSDDLMVELVPSCTDTDLNESPIAIQFNHVFMKYKYGPVALQGVSFTARQGERIGIVGRTGCGKSSLIAALFQMEKLLQGQILIHGQSITTLSSTDLHHKLCLIPQEPVLFSGSVRFNLDPLNEYSDDEVWHSLTAVNMKEYVGSLPGKLSEIVTESGDNFSSGQRQLICIARAVLRKPSILIMDEATAFMDSDSDKFIQRTLRTQFTDCTILTIAHRLHTIIDYDYIMVLDQGKVAEFDKPSVLIGKDEGIFKALWTTHNK